MTLGKFIIPVFNQFLRVFDFISVGVFIFLYDLLPSIQIYLSFFNLFRQGADFYRDGFLLLLIYSHFGFLDGLSLFIENHVLRRYKTMVSQFMGLKKVHLQRIFFMNLLLESLLTSFVTDACLAYDLTKNKERSDMLVMLWQVHL